MFQFYIFIRVVYDSNKYARYFFLVILLYFNEYIHTYIYISIFQVVKSLYAHSVQNPLFEIPGRAQLPLQNMIYIRKR